MQTECRWNTSLYTLHNAMIINSLCAKVQSVDKNRFFNLLLVKHELARTIRSKAVRQVLYVCKNENTLDLV